MWQAFTSEQMNRQGFGRRTFRIEESWLEGNIILFYFILFFFFFIMLIFN